MGVSVVSTPGFDIFTPGVEGSLVFLIFFGDRFGVSTPAGYEGSLVFLVFFGDRFVISTPGIWYIYLW